MKRKLRVKPSKASSLMGMIAGTIFVLIGLTVVIPNIGIFGVFWTLVAMAVIGMNAYNYFSKEGVASVEVDIDGSAAGLPSDDFAARLRKLTQLRNDGLITEDEFQQKRREILEEKW